MKNHKGVELFVEIVIYYFLMLFWGVGKASNLPLS